MIQVPRDDRSVIGQWWWTVDRWSLAAVLALIVSGMLLTLAQLLTGQKLLLRVGILLEWSRGVCFLMATWSLREIFRWGMGYMMQHPLPL